MDCSIDDGNDNNHMDVNNESGVELEAVSKKRFEDGYKACMKEIAQYLAEVEAMAPQDIRFLRLLCHLQNQNFEEIFTREKKSFKPTVKPVRLLARSTLSRLNGIHNPPTYEKPMNEDTFSDSNSDSPLCSLPKTPGSDKDVMSPSMSSTHSEGQFLSSMVTKLEPGDSSPCDLTCHTASNSIKIVNVASLTNYSITQPVVATTSSPTVSMVSNSSEEAASLSSTLTKPHCSITMTTPPQPSKSESPEERRRLPPPLLPVNTNSSPMPLNGLHTTTHHSHQTMNGNTPTTIATNPPQIVTFVPHPIPHPAPAKVITGSKLVVDPVTGQYFLLPPTHCIQIPTHVHVTPQGANHIVFNPPSAPGPILTPPQINHVITTNGHVISTSPNMTSNGVRLLQSQCPNAVLAVAPTSTVPSTKVPQSSMLDVKSPNEVCLGNQENTHAMSRYASCSSYISHNTPIMPGPPISPTINPIQALENIAKKDPR
ncbi:uncharacterized protein LOC144436531 isoform X2 [Glandiceps talaboti]